MRNVFFQLAVLERSITIRTLGYLKAAQTDGKWEETVAALGDTGRFTVPWMAAARAAKHAATTAAAAAAAAAGRGFESIPILDIFTHVTTALPAADVNALAKQFAYATVGVHGATLAGTQSEADRLDAERGKPKQRAQLTNRCESAPCRLGRRRFSGDGDDR